MKNLCRRSDGGCVLIEVVKIWMVMMTLVMHHMCESACPRNIPIQCVCVQGENGLMISCNNRRPALYEVPSPLPGSTDVLNLADNAIRSLRKEDFKYLEKMRTLNLQNNQIAFIASGAFDNLYSLETLMLKNNKLASITATMFQHLPSMSVIDLSNNRIRQIDKWAFLTLPASQRVREVTIKLTGNDNIQCGCEARALRDWARSLTTRDGLTGIRWDGFRCQNARGTELDYMRNGDFPACSSRSDRTVFDGNQKCITCNSASTQHKCDITGNSTCPGQETMCQSQVDMVNGKFTITKKCGLYTTCLAAERDNSRKCIADHSNPSSAVRCVFCCQGTDCSAGDIGGRTLSLKVYVNVRLKTSLKPYMLKRDSPRYENEANLYKRKVSELFKDLNGGYDVEFGSFQDENPCTLVSTLVYTTTLNTVDDTTVIKWMYEKVAMSANQGFLKWMNVAHYYVGAATPPDNTKKCSKETINTELGSITWEETQAGNTASVPCPNSSWASIQRRCVMMNTCTAAWSEPDISTCRQTSTTPTHTTPRHTTPRDKDTTTRDTTPTDTVQRDTTSADTIQRDIILRLEELHNLEITSSNVNNVLEQLDHLTADETTLTASDVSLAMDTMERALEQTDMLSDSTAMSYMVTALSNLIEVDTEVLTEADSVEHTASKILAATDKLSAEGKFSEDDRLMITGKNLVVAAQSVTPDSVNEGLMISADASADGMFRDGDVTVSTNANIRNGGASSLVLPSNLLASVSGERVAYTVHLSSKIFEVMKHHDDNTTAEAPDEVDYITKINSHVIAASIVGHHISSLQDPVTFTLPHENQNSTNPRCVFWDPVDLQWSSQGCYQVAYLSTANSTTCQCNHLTNFALLMDVYGHGVDLSAEDKKALSIISYIGCGLSLIALILTLVTYILFNTMSSARTTNEPASDQSYERKLRRDKPSKILMSLCVSLAMSNLIFVVGMHPYALNNTVGCKIVAVSLHFFLLSSLCWMAVEAFYMYLALVLVFNTYYSYFLLKCSVVGWGIPLMIVGITLGVNNTNNYGPVNLGLCWLQTTSFYAAFVGPVCLILTVNSIVFVLVLHQIMGLSKRQLNRSELFTTSQQLRSAVGVIILLGLTWLFAVLAIGQASVVFYYLFAIFNSLQGLWIFIFHCVMKREARITWKRIFSCCPAPDKKTISTDKDGNDASQHDGAAFTTSTGTPHQMQVLSGTNTTEMMDGTVSNSFTNLDTAQSQC